MCIPALEYFNRIQGPTDDQKRKLNHKILQCKNSKGQGSGCLGIIYVYKMYCNVQFYQQKLINSLTREIEGQKTTCMLKREVEAVF